MVDYTRLTATAERLITKNGRSIDFIDENETKINDDKPWLGSDASGDVTTSLFGVMVPPNTVRQFGLTALGQGTQYDDLIKFSEQILIVYPNDLDLRSFTHIQDQGVRWTIIGLQLLQPADTKLINFVGVRR